jgi:hypothetical protein
VSVEPATSAPTTSNHQVLNTVSTQLPLNDPESLKRCVASSAHEPLAKDGPGVIAQEVIQNVPCGAKDDGADKDHVSRGEDITSFHFDDHSIVTTNLTSELLVDDVTTSQASPNFVRHYASLMRDATAQITDMNAAISVTSFISQSAPGGSTRVPRGVSGRVFSYEIGRIPGENRHTLEVRFLSAVEIDQFDRAPLEKLYNAGVPSERFIISALQPTLHMQNTNLLRNISGAIEQNWEIYNNSSLYAKLIYWSVVRITS